VELIEIQTTGDQVRDVPLPNLGGEGIFTKELQRAVLAGEVDLAVHSLKDLPTVPVDGLTLAAVPQRGPVDDVLVARKYKNFDALPPGAMVATSSLRRRAQALFRRSDLQFVDVRGNVETRLRKLAGQGLDALILARAGLERLGLENEITEVLDREWMLPAVGQGALGLECRADDANIRSLLRALDDHPTRQAVLAERALLRTLGGGCQTPIGVATTWSDAVLALRAVVLSPNGRERVEAEGSGPADQPEDVGQHLADALLAQGAAKLLLSGRP
jgi:hydroxymethylbilane synthase